ncbi:MAG: stage II sporulation protein R [bacterium]
MKKVILIICIIVFFCFSLFDSKETQIRIRIIANSDSEVDQNYKREVVYYLYENYDLEFESYDECDRYLTNEYMNICDDLKSAFNSLEVTYETHNFYNKTYNNIVSNNQEYKTLLIQIGDASGENFWGVLYSDNFVENENTIKYNSYLLELFKKGE